ncbi:hypothetical protein COV04_04340 [Candidatus Uhrbacteria bacterium CG10_big_fil_rev_8_21_14_0_10_48_11]|uniref:Uncharacterized protein n=1 Tax=Candidatus Uhrbacteria bacterium CG10_big_fil_rev_8_21_14_0_10_48_11 TaxID=1975037 RepID=A0A2M8LDI8_9BACT|nr:MAG: hypothetical protein COV04_04340 [Candidatus Uhrbacteria bacterium CG10_big_fil_rev_8_21_14_0_10_48_11]
MKKGRGEELLPDLAGASEEVIRLAIDQEAKGLSIPTEEWVGLVPTFAVRTVMFANPMETGTQPYAIFRRRRDRWVVTTQPRIKAVDLTAEIPETHCLCDRTVKTEICYDWDIGHHVVAFHIFGTTGLTQLLDYFETRFGSKMCVPEWFIIPRDERWV